MLAYPRERYEALGRRTLGPAEDLVQQREFHLSIAGTTQMRAEVGGPQATVLHDLLQRRNQGLAHRIVEVVRLLDDLVDRLAFRAYKVVDPVELSSPLGVCREVPGHSMSFRLSRPLPSCRGVVGGVGEHLVAVLEFDRRSQVRPRRCSPAGRAWSAARPAGAVRRDRPRQARGPVEQAVVGSTSSLTRPRRSASSADTVRPVSIQSAATLGADDARQVSSSCPSPRPRARAGWRALPNVAAVAQIRMSEARHSARPAPTAGPVDGGDDRLRKVAGSPGAAPPWTPGSAAGRSPGAEASTVSARSRGRRCRSRSRDRCPSARRRAPSVGGRGRRASAMSSSRISSLTALRRAGRLSCRTTIPACGRSSYQGFGHGSQKRGRPSTCVAMMLRWISEVPPAMVPPKLRA